MGRAKKVLKVGCLVAALVPLLACCVWVFLPHPPSCPDRDRIHKGMTRDEVLASYGEPKEKHARPEGDYWYYDCGWLSPGSPISVSFDKDGRVEHAYILD